MVSKKVTNGMLADVWQYVDRSTTVAYKTVFDASNQSFEWWPVVIPLMVALVGVGILINYNRLPRALGAIKAVGAFTLIGVGLSVAIFLFVSTLSAYQTAGAIMSNNKAQIVEGTVQGLAVSSYGKAESFTVQGVQFSYSQYSASLGFHNVSTFGGPMKEGLHVKIWYADIQGDPSTPVILRLDIQQ
jgi:hypothetical protein